MLPDLRFALRALNRNRGFSLIAVLTLALGIGANSAIFSVVNAVLLRPLPFEAPDRLVRVFHVWEGSRELMSPANVTDVRDQSATLESLAYFRQGSITLTGHGEPARLTVARVSEGFFDVLRVRPMLGRALLPGDNLPGSHRVAVLAHGLWQQRFGGDPGIVGSTIAVNGEPFEVVGVMPAEFGYPAATELWVPQDYPSGVMGGGHRGAWWVSAVGRLRPGISQERAVREIEAIGARLESAYPESNAQVGITMLSMREAITGELRQPLFIMLGAVGLVLLIACANVANLLLARATTRETEMAVRSAVGAGRWRLTRQLLTESLTLALLGGAVGLVLARWGTRFLIALAPADIPRLDQVGLDLAVVAVTIGVSLLTGLLFGLVPALHFSRGDLLPALRSGGRGGVSSRGSGRARSTLVVAEMAFAVMLLVGAGLLIRSFLHLQQVDPGFTAGGALTFRVSLPTSEYDTEEKRSGFYAVLGERLASLPGVQAAGAVQNLPMTGGGFNLTFAVEGRPAARPGEELSSSIRVVTADYFSAIGIPLVRGRGFTADDRAGSPGAFLISEEAARRFFGAEDPIGKRITLNWVNAAEPPTGTVVGIVGDVRNFGLAQEADPTIYLPHAQQAVNSMDYVLRTTVPPMSLARSVSAAVGEIDPNLPLDEVRPLARIVSDSIATSSFYTLLLTAFSAVALTLSAIGIFGVVSYSVRQRTREIGLRLALGADPGGILRLVVGGAAGLAALGVGLGLAAAFVGSRVLGGLLYGVGAADPVTFAAVGGLLMAVALVAGYLPARRATRVEPVVALKGEG